MDKLLVNEYGEMQLYNTETNSIKPVPDGIEARNIKTIFFATEGGQVITSDEVVDYNANDLIIILSHWSKKPSIKAIVISDMCAKADMIEWFEQSKKKENETV